MSGRLYGIELPSDDSDAIKEISGFVNDGTPVTICLNRDDAEDFFGEQVIMVERE